MDWRSYKNIISQFVERFDEAVIQGILVHEDMALLKQRIGVDHGFEYTQNRES